MGPCFAMVPGAGSDQNLGTASVIVTSSGLLDLNNKSDSITGLTLETGRLNSANVQTGTGTLTLAGDVIVNTVGVTDGTSPAATISGKLNMVGGQVNINPTSTQANYSQQFNVSDTFVPSSNPDLIVTATIGQLTPVGGFLPGLREGTIPGANTTATFTPPAVTDPAVYPRLGETFSVQPAAVIAAWQRNTTWTYSGQFFSPTGIVSFGADLDDSAWVIIDGAAISIEPNDTSGTTGLLSLGMGPNGDGWHNIIIGVSNTGTNGGAASQWIQNFFGYGIAPNGTSGIQVGSYLMPVDSGNMNLFRYSATSNSSVYTLTKTGTGTLNLTGANTYTGGTVVNAGTVTYSGNGAANQIAAGNEVQDLTFGGTITGGTFTLTYNGLTTGFINWDPSSANLISNIQAALNGILGAGNTLVASPTPNVYSITFQGTLANAGLPQITVANSLTGTTPTISASTLAEGVGNASSVPHPGRHLGRIVRPASRGQGPSYTSEAE